MSVPIDEKLPVIKTCLLFRLPAQIGHGWTEEIDLKALVAVCQNLGIHVA
jgi:hypothetical protein